MEVYIEAHGFWDVIGEDEENQKKDKLALSAILSSIPESVIFEMDIRKSAREN